MFAVEHYSWPPNAVAGFDDEMAHRVDRDRAWELTPEMQPTPLPSSSSSSSSLAFAPPSGSTTPNLPSPTYARHPAKDWQPPRPRHRSRLRALLSRLSWPSLTGHRPRNSAKTQEGAAGRAAPDAAAVAGPSRQVTPAEWRTYGHWARPRVGYAYVRNATPPLVPRAALDEAELYDLLGELAEPGGGLSAHKWVPRLEHPVLAPCPQIFRRPPLAVSPPTTELQLNPFLAHRRVGRPPITMDVRLDEDEISLGDRPGPLPGLENPQAFRVDGPNGAQWATYPGVTTMRISAIADDACRQFPWPFIVQSHHPDIPITVEDVLLAVLYNFEQWMTRAEVNSLPPDRRVMLCRAYFVRVLPTWMSKRDGIRRVDYLGERFMFRGLEPAPDGKTFVMHFGLP